MPLFGVGEHVIKHQRGGPLPANVGRNFVTPISYRSGTHMSRSALCADTQSAKQRRDLLSGIGLIKPQNDKTSYSTCYLALQS